MPPKVYVSNYPAGDFRAMPAIGDGHALLKWVTSFPGNPARGLPTVTGLVLLSNAEDGRLLAVLDAAAVTALRTAAAGVLAADTLCRAEASSYAVIGCGVNGAETARMLVAHGVTPLVWDVDAGRRQLVAERLGTQEASSAAEALACEVVITVTPGQRSCTRRARSARPARVAHGRRRARKSRGRDRGASSRAPLLRRLGAGDQGNRRGGPRSRGRRHHARSGDRAEPGADRRGRRPPKRRRHHTVRLDGLAIQDLAIAKLATRSATSWNCRRSSSSTWRSRAASTHGRRSCSAYGELGQQNTSIRIPSGSKAKKA